MHLRCFDDSHANGGNRKNHMFTIIYQSTKDAQYKVQPTFFGSTKNEEERERGEKKRAVKTQNFI